jgi:hypothetical protein
MENNKLVGTIPPSIGDLIMLSSLHLQRNCITGSLPTRISELTNLVTLNLYSNSIFGTIPSSFSSLSALEYLSFGSNRLTGSIPPQLGQLNRIQSLLLHENSLVGTIPRNIADMLQTLKEFSFHSNSLSGIVPSESDLNHRPFSDYSNHHLSSTLPSGSLSRGGSTGDNPRYTIIGALQERLFGSPCGSDPSCGGEEPSERREPAEELLVNRELLRRSNASVNGTRVDSTSSGSSGSSWFGVSVLMILIACGSLYAFILGSSTDAHTRAMFTLFPAGSYTGPRGEIAMHATNTDSMAVARHVIVTAVPYHGTSSSSSSSSRSRRKISSSSSSSSPSGLLARSPAIQHKWLSPFYYLPRRPRIVRTGKLVVTVTFVLLVLTATADLWAGRVAQMMSERDVAGIALAVGAVGLLDSAVYCAAEYCLYSRNSLIRTSEGELHEADGAELSVPQSSAPQSSDDSRGDDGMIRNRGCMLEAMEALNRAELFRRSAAARKYPTRLSDAFDAAWGFRSVSLRLGEADGNALLHCWDQIAALRRECARAIDGIQRVIGSASRDPLALITVGDGEKLLQARRYLVLLFYLDLLPPLSAEVVRNQRDRVDWTNDGVSVSSKLGEILVPLTAGLTLLAQLYVIIWGFLFRSKYELIVASVFGLYILFDAIAISAISLAVRHFAFPSVSHHHVDAITNWLLKRIAVLNRPRGLSDAPCGLPGETDVPFRGKFNAASHFFLSHRVATTLSAPFLEHRALLSFETLWPKREFNVVPAESHPALWLVMDDSWSSLSKSATHFCAKMFFSLPISIQDLCINVLLWSSVIFTIYFHVLLFRHIWYLVLVPVAVIISYLVTVLFCRDNSSRNSRDAVDVADGICDTSGGNGDTLQALDSILDNFGYFIDRDTSEASINSTELFRMYDDMLLGSEADMRMPDVVLGESLAEISTLSDAHQFSTVENLITGDYFGEDVRRRRFSKTSLVSEGSLDNADKVASIFSASSRRSDLALANYTKRGEGVSSDEILRRLRNLTWNEHEYREAKSPAESLSSSGDVDSWQ